MFREIDKNWLRSFILKIVQPLAFGKFTDQSGLAGSITDVYPDGDLDVKVPQPFGFNAKIPPGVTAFYLSLFGQGQEQIAVGQMHFTRPVLNEFGDSVVYATTADGATVMASIMLKNDGTIAITGNAGLTINTQQAVTIQSAASLTITSNSDMILNSSGKVTVNSSSVTVGSGGSEASLNAESFKTLYNSGNFLDSLGVPVSIITPMAAAHLSQTVKIAK